LGGGVVQSSSVLVVVSGKRSRVLRGREEEVQHEDEDAWLLTFIGVLQPLL